MLKINKKWTKTICSWCLGIIGTLGILGLITWLIYIIPNCEIKNIALSLTVAFVGGLITLIVVKLTISNSEKSFRLENKMKNKPIIILVGSRISLDSNIKINKIAKIHENPDASYCAWCVIKNISQMPCKVIGINYLGKKIQSLDRYLWMENQENVQLYFHADNFNYKNSKEIELILADISGIEYIYLLEYNAAGNIVSIREKE